MQEYIFIHGLGQNSISWEKTISFLSEKNNTHLLNLWEMQNGSEVTYANLYRSFSDYCSNVSGKINLCGLSLGAILALNYAIECPEKVQSIVLIGAQYKMPKALLKFQNIIFRLMPEKSFQDIGLPKKDVIKLTNSMADLDFSSSLRNVLCTALILCGDKDTANRKAMKTIAQQIPNSEFQLIGNAGHEVNIESSQALANALDIFWRSQSS
jgi:pimeloyl-ACP methyl ester carboxylesterase